MTKDEAARALGISRRTLQRRMAKGEIAYTLLAVPRGEEAVFDRAEVERVRAADKAKLSGVTQAPAVVSPLPSSLPARRPQRQSEPALRLEPLVAEAVYLAALPAKMTYNLREAAMISGLTLTHIRQAIRQGSLEAINLPGVRGRRIHREALIHYVRGLFTAMETHPQAAHFTFAPVPNRSRMGTGQQGEER